MCGSDDVHSSKLEFELEQDNPKSWMDCFDLVLLSWFNLDDVFFPDPGSNEKKAHLARLDKSVLRQISMFWIWLNHVKLMIHQAETFGSVDQDIANCFNLSPI